MTRRASWRRASFTAWVLLVVVAGGPAPSGAQTRPGLDCNLFGPDEPCDPSLLYPPAQDLRLIIRSRHLDPDRQRETTETKLNTLRELNAALRACWVPPPADRGRTGMELTVRFSFNRAGRIIGQPRFTYVSRVGNPAEQELYRRAVLDSLAGCTPLPFTAGLGRAIAGRPLTIRFIDDRRPRGTAGLAQQRTNS